MIIECPKCHQSYDADEQYYGKDIQCSCGQIFSCPIPAPAPLSASAENTDLDHKTKTCPFCGEEILAVALKCKHCGEFLNDKKEEPKVTIQGVDPFSGYHTEIQGKKEGNLTVIGGIGIVFGVILFIIGLNFSFTAGKEDIGFVGIGFGVFFIVGCFFWARKK